MARQTNTKSATRKITGDELRGTFINPLTDYGFKRIFGEEANKDLLMDFLNAVLEIEDKITHLEYRNIEQKGRIKTKRGAFFDLYCTTGKGEHIIIEMQNLPQTYFRDRALYYITFPIQKQAKKNKWNFQLNSVYSVNILNFRFNDEDTGQYIHHIQLMDRKNKDVFYDKLAFVFVELPDFTKPENELKTQKDCWLYVLKHLAGLQKMPDKLKNNRIFQKLFGEAKIANMTPKELELYEQSLKNHRDMYTTRDIVKDYRDENTKLKKENMKLHKEIAELRREAAQKGISAPRTARVTKSKTKAQ